LKKPEKELESKAIFKKGNIEISLQIEIFDHVQKLLTDGHYFNAVEESYKIVRKKLKNITGKSILRCYTIPDIKKLSKHEKEDHIKDKKKANKPEPAYVVNFINKSYYPFKINKKLSHISELFGINKIMLYPNLSDNDLFPKGSVIVSDSLYPNIGIRFGRGTTVYFIKNLYILSFFYKN
jgi:hypothetical protein